MKPVSNTFYVGLQEEEIFQQLRQDRSSAGTHPLPLAWLDTGSQDLDRPDLTQHQAFVRGPSSETATRRRRSRGPVNSFSTEQESAKQVVCAASLTLALAEECLSVIPGSVDSR